MKGKFTLAALGLLAAAIVPVQAQQADGPGVITPQISSANGPAFVYQVPAADVEKAMADAREATARGEKFENRNPFLHLLFHAGPNMVSIENRPTAAPEFTLHKLEYELFYVLEGSGTMYTGGTLVNPTSNDEANAGAKSATGGREVKMVKGDIIMVPPSTVHSVTQSDGKLVLFVVHMPAIDGSGKIQTR